MEKEKIIKLWKELGVEQVIFNFDCGGDNMGNTDWSIETATGSTHNQEIEDYFDDQVYRNVDFYVNSDGHYQGESGQVIIELVEDDEPYFSYSKQAKSEWSEIITNNVEIKLTEKEAEFIKKNILNFNGDESEINSVFNGDLFLTDEDEAFLGELEEKILNELQNFEPEIEEGELEEWFNYNTHEDNLTINDNNELVVEVHNRVMVFRDSD